MSMHCNRAGVEAAKSACAFIDLRPALCYTAAIMTQPGDFRNAVEGPNVDARHHAHHLTSQPTFRVEVC